MPRWYEDTAKLLLDLAVNDPGLFHDVVEAIRSIANNPRQCAPMPNGARVFRDPQRRFRIGYDYAPGAPEPVTIFSLFLR